MSAKLQYQAPGGDPVEIPLGNTATIGRSRDNTLALAGSALVSRQHALIRCHNGYEYQLIDLGSRNGTFVNDQRVVMPTTLQSGARIRVGSEEIQFIIEESEDDSAGATMAATMGGAGAAPIESQEVSLLVCDIRGFSTVAETISSGDLAQFLGGWFREAGDLVHNTSGIIDKFLGDALLAYWPKSASGASEAERALEVAGRLHDLACSMTWPVSARKFEIVVALHFGKVTFGNIGVMAQRDATVIGDAVNTLFRLEPLCKQLGQPILVSESFYQRASEPARFTDLGEHELKGKAQRVRVYGCATVNSR